MSNDISHSFHEQIYLEEMANLVAEALVRWRRTETDTSVYTISISTDANQGMSSLAIDTRANSDAKLLEAAQFAESEHKRLIAEGDLEMAELFRPRPVAARSTNPADFAFSDYVRTTHHSFPAQWEEQSQAACWERLLPALEKVGLNAASFLAELPSEPDAELAINNDHEWYGKAWPIEP